MRVLLGVLTAVWMVACGSTGGGDDSSSGGDDDPSDMGWHFENPTPDNLTRNDVFAIAANDMWSVAEGGLVEHWDGTEWTQVPSGTDADLHGVWASGSSDVWVVGDKGTLLRWNGSAFAKLDAHTSRALYAVDGSSADNVWIVGENDANALAGLILHWTGTELRVSQAADCPNTLFTVLARSPSDVWVGGAVKTACHYTGTAWTYAAFDSPNQDAVQEIWQAKDGGPIWGLFGGSIYRRDASAWTHVYSVPYLGDGSVSALNGLGGTSGTDVWAVGTEGYVARWNGTAWTASRVAGDTTYTAIATASGEGWMVGYAGRARLSGGTWTETYTAATRDTLISIVGASPNSLWARGANGGVVRRMGTGWTKVNVANSMNYDLLHVASENDVWLIGSFGTAHFDGNTFTAQTDIPYSSPLGVWGTGTDLWVVGYDGKVLHREGAAWKTVTVPASGNLVGVGGSSPTDVWAVGAQNTILHFDGSTWTKVATDPQSPDRNTSWSSVVAFAANDVWVGGESTRVMHWNGTSWSAHETGGTDNTWLRRGVAVAADDVWWIDANYPNEELVHWNGSTFERTPVHGASNFTVIPGEGMWLSGASGMIRRRSL